MRDLIDRSAIKLPPHFFEDVNNVPKFYEWLNSLPAASPWHRVEEGLPEIGKRVLVSYGGYVQILKHIDSMTYNGRYYWWNEAEGLWERVEEGSYWMPIEPPKEDA